MSSPLNKWNVDDQAAKLMNEVASELKVKSSEVRLILESYYSNASKVMSDGNFIKIQIFDFFALRPIPVFLERRAKKLKMENKEKNQILIEAYTKRAAEIKQQKINHHRSKENQSNKSIKNNECQ